MKKVKKSTVKIAAATSMCIFSLASVFSATIAWFNMMQQEAARNETLNITSTTGILDYVDFHRCTSIIRDSEGNPTNLHFDKTAYTTLTYNWNDNTISGDVADLSLDTYTPIDPDHPILAVFALKEDYASTIAGSIQIKAQSSASGFLGARNGNSPVYTLGDSNVYIKAETVNNKTIHYYALSSVAEFSYKDFSSTEYTTFSSGSDLSFAVSDLTRNETFVEVDNVAETSTFNDHPVLYSSTDNDTVQYIAVVIDYYSDAIEFIYSTYLGDTTLEDTYEGYLHFICDWSMEVS